MASTGPAIVVPTCDVKNAKLDCPDATRAVANGRVSELRSPWTGANLDNNPLSQQSIKLSNVFF